MNANQAVLAHPQWSTASHADAASNLPTELTSLSAHLGQCLGSRGRWFGVECLGEAVHGFIAPRVVTTLALASLVLGAASLLG